MYYSWLQITPRLRRHFCPATTTTVTRHSVRCTKKVTGMHEWPHLIIMFVNSMLCSLDINTEIQESP